MTLKNKKIWIAVASLLLIPAISLPYLNAQKHKGAKETLSQFLGNLKNGEAGRSIAFLGSEGCSCSPPGGWQSYLTYGSGLEPNIAFLLGSKFSDSLEELSAEYADPTHKNVIHRQAKLCLQFPHGLEPFLLPVKLAFGSEMTSEQLEAYSRSPDSDGLKGLTLRLRSKLGKGSITPPPELSEKPKSHKDKEVSDLFDPTKLAEEFGSDTAFMLFPSDKGTVNGPEDKKLSPEELKSRLPRLQQISLRVDLVRRKDGNQWKIWKCIPEDPMLEIPSGKRIAISTTATL